MQYDADFHPHGPGWLATSEEDRLDAVISHHEDAGPPLHAEGERPMLHASMHLAVENQLAEGHEAATRTLKRLVDEGIRRHAAVHMIMEVLVRRFAALRTGGGWDAEQYAADLDALDAGAWIGERMRRDLGAVDL